MKTYLQKKIAEHKSFVEYFDLPYISNRQSQILQILVEKPHSVFTARELTNMFGITAKTARTDLQGLVALGLLKEKPLNQRTIVSRTLHKDFHLSEAAKAASILSKVFLMFLLETIFSAKPDVFVLRLQTNKRSQTFAHDLQSSSS